MIEFPMLERDQYLVLELRHVIDAAVLAAHQRGDRRPMAGLRRLQPGKRDFDAGILLVDLLDEADDHAVDVLRPVGHSSPSNGPVTSRRALNLVMYPPSLLVWVESVTKYVPEKRAPRPSICTFPTARRSCSTMQVRLALPI